MQVRELIKQLKQTSFNNEVRIIGTETDYDDEYTKELYLSFDDIGDVLIYELKENEGK